MKIQQHTGTHILACLLVGLIAPGILFTFYLLFGSASYQYWADRYHYNLTNKYLFSRTPDDSLLGPLWRDETLSGNIWITNLVTSPFALDIVAGRLLELSPFGIDLIGSFTLYFVAAVSMFWYLRTGLIVSVGSATVCAVMFGATAYFVSTMAGNPDMPMAAAWVPALLAMSHRIQAAGSLGWKVVRPTIGLAVLFYAMALHSTLASLPLSVVLVLAYALFVLRSGGAILSVLAGLVLGILLDAPFLWQFVEASSISHRNVEGFYELVPFSLGRWVDHGWVMVSQVALGHNRYGIYVGVVLIAGVWLVIGSRWDQDPALVRRILLFGMGTSLAMYGIELLHEPTRVLMSRIPLLRGWDFSRVSIFAFFGLLIAIAWMLDRSLLAPGLAPVSRNRLRLLRMVLLLVGMASALQIGYSAYRMRLVPSTVYPQDLLLDVYLCLYAVVLLGLLTSVFRAIGPADEEPLRSNAHSPRQAWVVLLVLSVSLVVSVHGYRAGVLPSGSAASVKTYADRYKIPEEILQIKRLNTEDGRVVDLTRPLNESSWLAETEVTLLPLAGLRTPSGYSNLYPAWYGRLIHTAISGRTGRMWNILEIEPGPEANMELLGLLDVRYILAPEGFRLLSYVPADVAVATGKSLYRAADERVARPAFVAPAVQCFTDDSDALRYLNRTNLDSLRTRVVLVASDAESETLCADRQSLPVSAGRTFSAMQIRRGWDRVELQISHTAGGILTLADTYYPGWKVFVDGVERPVLRTYIALRGVVIGPGSHSVQFLYAAPVFHALLKLSTALFVLLLLIALTIRGRSRGLVATSSAPEQAQRRQQSLGRLVD